MDFQPIFSTKLECRPSLKFLRTFNTVGDSVPVYFVQLAKCQFSHSPGHSLFQLLSIKVNLDFFKQSRSFNDLPGLFF